MEMGDSKYILTYDNEKVLVRTVSDYQYNGIYMHSDKAGVEKRNICFDEQGIPQFNFRWGTYYYPITIAQYALQHHALFLLHGKKENYDIFLKMAKYFLQTQDNKGGWPTHFDHLFYKGRTQEMKAPWYSAMAQGQVISVLVRAFDLTKEEKYLNAAKKGILLYSIPVEYGGVLRKFNSKYNFYEEYPTEPGSFVLNGFIYSLLGLYDLKNVWNDKVLDELYEEGMKTLKNIISYYDLGHRSAYDLTHLSTPGSSPNIARWAYHSTHLLQLSAIKCITNNDEVFSGVLYRWLDYMVGKFPKTN